MQPALKTTDLQIGYVSGKKTKTVAGPLNATLQAGELVCIMGANGIGKSTFIKTIAGLQQPLAGRVAVSGADIHQLSNRERAKRLAVVLTGRPAAHFLTVHQLVALGRYPHTNWKNTLTRQDTAAIDQALEAVGLTDDADTPVAELSDGNAQKALIARALAQETPLVVLDEPTVHLDLRNKSMILQLLLKLSRKYQKSILLASHDLHMMMQVADKLWLFHREQLVCGLPEDMLLNGYLERLLGPTLINPTGQPQIEIDGEEEVATLVLQALAKAGLAKAVLPARVKVKRLPHGVEIQAKETYSSIEDFVNSLAHTRHRTQSGDPPPAISSK